MPTRPQVLVLDDYEGGVSGSPHLAELADRVELTALREPVSQRQLARAVEGVPVVIAIRERTGFSAETLAHLRGVELLLQTGGHAYHVDVPAATREGIMVALGRGSTTPAPVIAELVIGLMIAWYRRLVPTGQAMRAGAWPATLGRLLHGRTLGVLGLGRHGVMVARLARAMGMRVLAWSTSMTPERAAAEQVEAAGFDDLLVRSDVVSIHLRLAPETTGLVGARELALMGPHSVLVNTSRGAIVDEAALVDALRSGTIEGAALDVFTQEPLPPDHPLRRLDNVLCTPHIGYTVDAAFDDFALTSAAQLRAYLDHRLDPALVLNPAVAWERPGQWGGLLADC
ncbi:D-2-hydroxyacid dehydrogenase family protein [Jiangella asiatica]|uniref:D-2-hydroxyacid dehydrogenase family protein n=1 Tax=Jiangella asiatica TaxID=2530372 RepID=A0A4R5DB35_9ACTN|nr:D-2-hydroxyacid dehydrogenase family protein [Jiangella asiatica]TDE07453.1 D-2-hydroxyacid dehydrogenase family protein [Jiangella asiatica]